MSNDPCRISLRYKPRSGPRRQIGFEPDQTLGEAAYATWRIEEVYSVTKGKWREVGREHITDVGVTAEPAMNDLDVEGQSNQDERVSDHELLSTAEAQLKRAIELSSDGRPADTRAAVRRAAQYLEAVRHARTAEVLAE